MKVSNWWYLASVFICAQNLGFAICLYLKHDIFSAFAFIMTAVAWGFIATIFLRIMK